MGDDPCADLRKLYDQCIQTWLDEAYFKGQVKGPFTPCEPELAKYHVCMKTDPRRKDYLLKLDEYKQYLRDGPKN
jgi:hypothetical protein